MTPHQQVLYYIITLSTETHVHSHCHQLCSHLAGMAVEAGQLLDSFGPKLIVLVLVLRCLPGIELVSQ